jgi:hypothetical protein
MASLPNIYPNSIGDEAVDDFGPLLEKYGDPLNSLNIYLHALGNMLKQVDDISKDGPDGEPGWSQIFDLNRAKTEWLPWTGQLVGYPVPERPDTQTFAEYDAIQRERIITRSAYRRGTAELLQEVVKEQLNEPKRALVHERYGGNPYWIKLWVWAGDIATSEAEVERAALSQKVAGLIMNFDVLEAADSYNVLNASNVSYGEVLATHDDYVSVLENPSL